MDAIKQNLLNIIQFIKPNAQNILNIVFAISIITLVTLNTQYKNELAKVSNDIKDNENTIKGVKRTQSINDLSIASDLEDLEDRSDNLFTRIYKLDYDLSSRLNKNECDISYIETFTVDSIPEAYNLSDATYYDFNSNFGFKRAVAEQIGENIDYGDSVRNEIVSIVKETVDSYCAVKIDIEYFSALDDYYVSSDLSCN